MTVVKLCALVDGVTSDASGNYYNAKGVRYPTFFGAVKIIN